MRTELDLALQVNPELLTALQDISAAMPSGGNHAAQLVLDLLTLSALMMGQISDEPEEDLHAWLDKALVYAKETRCAKA